MIAGMPFALAADLDARAVHEQVQRATAATVRQLHGQGLLPSAERREVRHRPLEAGQLHKARDKASCLAKR